MAYATLVTVKGEVEAPLWRSLAEATAPATIYELHVKTAAHPNAIQHRLSRWVQAGLVTQFKGKPGRYIMNDNVDARGGPPRVSLDGKAAPRPATAQDKMWRAMRVLRRFDLPTLIISAGVSRTAAQNYINCLNRSGHLRRASRGNPTRGTWSIYALVKNSGPRSPRICHRVAPDGRIREVLDRNNDARTDISPRAVSLRSKKSAPAVDGGVS